uniref:Uncharacterized protein n=1 Tax=Timema shepardi TaxID=629360 RepID=A0A7R9AS89_TIMSH|nr:unnamed protein product [Timema shepardi]
MLAWDRTMISPSFGSPVYCKSSALYHVAILTADDGEIRALEKRLEKTEQSQADLADQLDKLEEKSIELEGTRARVRVLERIQYRAASEEEDPPPMIPPEASTNLVIPLLALPMPIDDIASATHDDTVHHSSSTESAHDHTDTVETKKAPEPPLSPRRRPSKIPLPPSSKGTKPPTGRTGTPSRCRPDSSNSVSLNSGNKSGNKSKTDSLKTRNNSLSGVGSRTRDSLSAGGKSSLGKQRSNSDSLSSSSRLSLSSNKSLKGSLSSVSGRKTPHHQAARRAGNVTANTRGGLIEPDEQGSKVRSNKLSFWSNWLKILDNTPS